VSCFHVLGRALDWKVEVEIETENGSCDQNDEDGECSILKVGNLNLHWSHFDTPANVTPRWGWFESHVLPICRLQVLEVVDFVQIERYEVLVENYDRIADEKVGKVRREEIVHTTFNQTCFEFFVDDKIRIEVFRP